jgi:hypothetical protein
LEENESVLASCNNHPSVKAVVNCSQCHKPACAQCVVGGKFCSVACSEKFQKFATGYKKPQDLSRSGIVPTIFFLAVVAGGYYLARYVFHWF